MTVEEIKAVDIRTVCSEELVDITKFSIDKSLEEDDRKVPGLPEAYHPKTDYGAHEKNAGECDAIGAK